MQLVPSLDDKGASSDVCARVQSPESVKVCPVPLPNPDRWKVAPAQPRLHWVLGTHSTNHTHTLHTRSGLFRVLVWFGAYHYTPLGAARLTEVDWHCQELSQPSVWIYIRAPSRFAKAFVFLLGNPFHAQMIDDDKKKKVWDQWIDCARRPVMKTSQTRLKLRDFCRHLSAPVCVVPYW